MTSDPARSPSSLALPRFRPEMVAGIAPASLEVTLEGSRVLVRAKDHLAWWPRKGHLYLAIGVAGVLLYLLDNYGVTVAAFVGGVLLASSALLFKARPRRQGFWFEANRWGFTGTAESRDGKCADDPVFDSQAAVTSTIVCEGRARWLIVPRQIPKGEQVEIRVRFDEATASDFVGLLRGYGRLAA